MMNEMKFLINLSIYGMIRDCKHLSSLVVICAEQCGTEGFGDGAGDGDAGRQCRRKLAERWHQARRRRGGNYKSATAEMWFMSV